MVASAWGWDSAHMLVTFGWKAALAVLCNATLATLVCAGTCGTSRRRGPVGGDAPTPLPVVLVHLAFLAGVVALAHHPVAFLGLFLMFLGYTQAYERHQDFGAVGLTAITDNAGLTYLGSLIVGLPEEARYTLVAGVALLKRGFADQSIGAGELLLGALGPTAVAAAAFLLL